MKCDLIGAHMSVAGGFTKAWDRGEAVGCHAIQIFTKNNMQWEAPLLAERAAEDFIQRSKLLKFPVCGHAGYLINLGAFQNPTAKRSLKSLADELFRAEKLGLPFLVLHPGSHMGAGEAAGIETISKNLKSVLKKSPTKKVKIALETTAGQGNCLGHRFEHLAEIYDRVGMPSRMGFCFDTCHVFAAGYDISRARGLANTFKEFDRLIGLEKILAFHFNDSKTGLGSRVDRHDHIGKGHIGIEPFREILNTPAFSKVPKILETPKGDEGREDITNLKVLRSLIHRN
jgi:deoxyribonuclease IV